MTTSIPAHDPELLRRLVGRLAPYVADNTLRRTRLDRVLDTVAADDALRAAVRSAVTTAGIRLVDDEPLVPVPPPAAPARVPTQSRRPVPAEEVGHQFHDNPASAIAAARRRLESDRRTVRLDQKLLTAQEECGLGLMLRAGSGPLEPGGIADLNGERRAAAEALILHNTKLVHFVAQAHRTFGLEYDDLIGHGTIGLMRAVELFDPAAGTKFSTYATCWIRQAIGRGIANESRLIRVPVHMHEQMLKVAKARARLSADGSTPSTADLAFATELTEQQVRDCRRLTASVTSLDRPVGDGLTTLGDLLDPVVDEPDGWLSGGLCRDDVDDALSVLPEREAKVVALRFGFVDDEPQTLEEIGQQFGVTRERIRQIEVKALAKLRERLARRIRETRGAGLAVAEPPAVPERDRAEARAWCVATFDASLLSHLFGGFLGAGGNAADRVVHQETAAVYLAAACQALTTLRVAEVRELLQAPMQGLDGATIPEYALAVPATKRSVRTVRAAVATHLRSIRPRAAA